MGASTVPKWWRGSDKQRKRADEILPQFERMVVKQARRLGMINGYDLSDLIQEGRMLAYWAISTWKAKNGRSLSSWIHLVLENNLRKIKRHENRIKRRRIEVHLDTFTEDQEPMTLEMEPMERLVHADEDRMVREVLSGLGEMDRRIIEARMEGRSLTKRGVSRYVEKQARERARQVLLRKVV